jgi:hypothetical protein
MLTYKGKKIADRGVVVNLPHRKDRREKSDSVLKSLGFDGYEYIEGIVHTEQEWKRYGLTQTYINCAKNAIDDNIESLVVFEDDIKIMNGVSVEDFDKIFEKWDAFSENYDLIAMGTRPLIDSTITKDDENFGTVSNTLCTQAFLYKRTFLDYLYNTLKNYNVPGDPYYKVIIDEFINDCCSHEIIYKTKNKLFKVGITIPMLFTQHSGFSDIENSEQNYDGWMEHCYWTAIKKGEK